MNDSLHGNLHEGVLVNVMQYLAMNSGAGCLTLRQPDGQQGQVFFEAGSVIHVCVGSHQGVRAMAMLLEWREGGYAFRAEVVTLRTMRSSIERLLLEAVMYSDVSKKNGHNPFYEDSILTARPLKKDQVVSVSIRAVQLLPQLDGLRTLGEIARATQLPLPDIVQAANELHQQSLTDHRAITIATDFTLGLKDLMVHIMGPMGEIVVEDALYDLGVSPMAVPQRLVPALLRGLENEIQHRRWREEFDLGAKQLCLQYGISVTGQRSLA
jgi:hypothetical protein